MTTPPRCAFVFAFLALVLVSTANAVSRPVIEDYRTPRAGFLKQVATNWNWFNLRLLQPFECTANSSNEIGTCMSAKDCGTAGGKVAGECLEGYASCCVIKASCGDDVERNRTYIIRNSTSTGSFSCNYNIEMPKNDSELPFYNNVCQVRLDFESLTLDGPDTTTSLCATDYFEVSGSSASFGKICGENSGQHIYLPIKESGTIATVKIAGSAAAAAKEWKIKVNYLPCDSELIAPDGCLQYYQQTSGTINSFNTKEASTSATDLTQIGGLNYAACISTDPGQCGVKLTAKKFSITEDDTAATKVAKTGTDCALDSVGIVTKDKAGVISPGTTYNCGTKLDPISTYASPFAIQVTTDDSEAATEKANKGFTFEYERLTC